MASIEKRGKNSWRLVVEAGYNSQGKREKRYKSIKITDEALLKTTKKLQDHLKLELSKFQIEVEAGEYISPEKMSFSAFVEEWRKKYAIKNLEPTTVADYDRKLNNHIIPYFSTKRLDQIRPMHVLSFLDELSQPGGRKDGKEGGLSGTSRRFVHRVLKDILERAVEWKIIKSNPAAEVKRPKLDTKEAKAYFEDELIQMFVALENEPLKWRVFVELAVTTGMRRGELLALDINKHIQIENDSTGHIDISESLAYVGGKPLFKDVKTKKSRRSISLGSDIIPLLKELIIEVKKSKLQLGDAWEGGDRLLLFGQWNGLPTYHTTPGQWFSRFLKRHALKPIPLHGLRHSSATYLIAKKVPLKQIQERLGHADIRTTGNIYAHAIKELDKESAETFNSLRKRSN